MHEHFNIWLQHSFNCLTIVFWVVLTWKFAEGFIQDLRQGVRQLKGRVYLTAMFLLGLLLTFYMALAVVHYGILVFEFIIAQTISWMMEEVTYSLTVRQGELGWPLM